MAEASDMKRIPLDESENPPTYGVATQSGVRKAEALQNPKVWGKFSTLLLFIGIGMMAYIYSLDGVTTWLYTAIATSDFSQHSLLGAVSTVSAIVLAVAKPISSKLADVFGRTEAWVFAVVIYTVGFIVLAACGSVEVYAAGWIIRSAGYAAVQILMQIVIGDVTTLRWRTFSSALVSLPYLVNGFVGSKIGAAVNNGPGWRWGYGMFCIMLPAAALPLIGILAWSQWKSYKLGVVHTSNPYEETQLRHEKVKTPIARAFIAGCTEVDLIGLLLFTIGWTCLLLPLTLANSGTLPWSNYKILTMIIIGPITLVGLGIWEGRFARYPFIPFRFLRNPTVLAAALIGFFDFISFYLQFTFQYSFIYIVKDWSFVNQNYFAQTQTVALTFFGILAGAFILWYRRYKWLLLGGLLVRLFAVGLMIHSKGANGTTGELVIVQVLQGLGGGIAAVTCQTAAQASVSHQDLASVTAVVLLFAEIGGAIGTAIATAIWRHIMPDQLNLALSGLLPQADIDAIFSSIVTAATYDFNSPVRNGAIHAYDYTMKIILIVATIVAVIPPLLVFMMKNLVLGDEQNTIEGRAPDGESLSDSHDLEDGKKHYSNGH